MSRRGAMERLSHSAVGSAGSVHLRYGYVPPSLRRLRDQRRDRQLQLLARLALTLLVLVTAAAAAYRWQPAPIAVASDLAESGRQAVPVAAPAVPAIGTVAAVDRPAAAATAAPMTTSGPTSPDIVGMLPVPSLALHVDVIPPVRVRARDSEQMRVDAVPSPTAIPVRPLDVVGLRRALQAVTACADGSYGIAVIDLTSGEELDLDADRPMNAASVNKLEILAALYHEVEQGRLHLDQRLMTTPDDMQDYGTGVIRYQPIGTTYTLAQLAQLLIEQSDNTASYMLAQTIGLDTIERLVQGWGLHTTIVGQLQSSPQDAAHFMLLLYRGKLADAADTRQMLDYLEHTAFNDRIPAALPASVTVAHKIGTQVNVENDVAVVELPGRPYILSIFAKDATEEQAVPVEQAISRTVYQFEQQAKGAA